MLVKVAFPRPATGFFTTQAEKKHEFTMAREQNTNEIPTSEWKRVKNIWWKKKSWGLTWRIGSDHWISFFFASYTVYIVIAHYHMFCRKFNRCRGGFCRVGVVFVDGGNFRTLWWPLFWLDEMALFLERERPSQYRCHFVFHVDTYITKKCHSVCPPNKLHL